MRLPKMRGFSLIELLVAISIIAILTAVGVVSYTSINKRSRDVKRKSDLEQLRSALELFRADNGYYPGGCGGGWSDASCLSSDLATSSYMSGIPTDPKGMAYRFQATNLSGANYYGYCLATTVETDIPAAGSLPCSPESGYNYTVKNP